jgi:hypothetical protein
MERCSLPRSPTATPSPITRDRGRRRSATAKAKEISGYPGADDNTLVCSCSSRWASSPLRTRCVALHDPGPEELRGQVDKGKSQSTYGQHQVSPGPYMVERRLRQVTGMSPGKPHAGPQPELGPKDGLQARLPRQDHHPRAATTSPSRAARSCRDRA